MKSLSILSISFISLFFLLSCDVEINNQQEKEIAPVISKSNLQLNSDIMTPEVLWSFGRVSDIQLSPDHDKVLFGISYYSKEQNKGNRDLYLIDLSDENKMTRLTNTAGGEYNAIWIPGTNEIAFLSAESGSMQLYKIHEDGSGKEQISDFELGITGFKFASDGSTVLFTAEVPKNNSAKDIYPDLDKAKGRIVTQMMERHWDTWVDSYSHIFYAKLEGGNFTEAVDIMKDEPFESPLKPFGGMEQISWDNNANKIFYTCRKKVGREYAVSTNSDIYEYDINTGLTINHSDGMMGYDVAPVISPDGQYLAWESMKRDGYESDKNRLIIKNLETGEIQNLSKNIDQNVHGIVWSGDSKKIYFTSEWRGSLEIFSVSLEDQKFEQLTEGRHNYLSLLYANEHLITTRQSMSMPTEIFKVSLADGSDQQISNINSDLLEQLTMGKIEKRWVTTPDNKQMLTWVIYPPHFDKNKKYPALLYCQGGPQSMVSQFWSYRWNFQMMAANNYIIVAPNRRGLPGFGQEWNEQISGDYGGQNMKDYLSAIDVLSSEPYIDESKLGAVGASYGGFSVFWLAGNHEGRFKAFIAHDGIFNFESQYLETEEMWFVNWDLGGPFWDKTNTTAQKSYATSPHKFIDKWDTPIMIIHGEQDYRIVYTQGLSAFNAARLRNIPAELLFFPDENHWVLSPQNGILWQRRFFNWLDQWLKE